MATENESAWSTTAATNANIDLGINWAEGQDAATVNNSGRGMMAARAKARRDQGGYLTATNTANALQVTTQQVLTAPDLAAGQRLLIRAIFDNTSTTVTLAPDGLTAAPIKRADGSALAVGDITIGKYLDLVYNAGSSEWRAVNIAGNGARGQLYGLTLSNNSGDATNDIDIATGEATDGTTLMVLAGALTKRLDAAWAVGTNVGGRDTGAIANGTYHVWLIARSDTGIVDVLFSASASSPTMPANYDRKRRIGSILREAAAIVGFDQVGDTFLRNVAAQDIATSTLGTTAFSFTLSVPTGIIVDALLSGITSHGSSTAYILLTSPSQSDTAPSTSQYNALALPVGTSNSANYPWYLTIRTSTSGQIRARSGQTLTSIEGYTRGWIDTRGRLA